MPTPRELLEQLVAYDTTSGTSTRGITGFIEDALGPDVRVQLFPDATGLHVNLLAIAGPEPTEGREGLTLSGHLDVVPATEAGWESEPFTPTIREGRLYARGSTDMKGFIAIAIRAMRDAAGAGRLTRPLALLLTHNEEVGSLGAQAMVRDLPRSQHLPRHCIVGEPTSLSVVRMHKGHLKLRFTLRGKAAHSGTPHLGRSAIEPAGRLIVALAELRREFEAIRTDTSDLFPEVPHPVLNLGRVSGGGALNVIPDSCEVDIGLRLLPGMTGGPSRARLESLAREVTGMARLEAEVLNDNPSMLLPEQAFIHQAALALTGQEGSRGVSYASDAGILSREMDMDCILWGPGDMGVAHRPNEYIQLDELERGGVMLERFIARFCTDAGEQA